ncbi:hypothetical protein H1R20_g4, partial [Candolleomyces eurysporus]
MNTLIVRPFSHLRERVDLDLTTFPYAILIDGLDECQGEARQAELLAAIRLCLLATNLPFRIFLASRPEMAIRTALEPGGHLHRVANHLRLSDKYYAEKDMCRYLRRRFRALSPRVGNPQWFTEKDINVLAEAASGQFVYVATAYNYISQPRGSPADRLKIVLTWTPHEGQVARPFEALDRLYANILLAAKEAYEAVDTHRGRDFLMLFRTYQLNSTQELPWCATRQYDLALLSSLLGVEHNALKILISDLHSLVTLEGASLRRYHKSFYDFLDHESRSKNLFISCHRVLGYIERRRLSYIIKYPWELESDGWGTLGLFLLDAGFWMFSFEGDDLDHEIVEFTQKGGWNKIDKLLSLARQKSFQGLRDVHWSNLVWSLSRFAVDLNNRKPETAAILNKHVEKWLRDIEVWRL